MNQMKTPYNFSSATLILPRDFAYIIILVI